MNKIKKLIERLHITPLIFAKWVIVIGVWSGTLFSAYLLYIFHDLPSIDTLEEIRRSRKVTILDNKEQIISTYGDIYGRYIYYYEIPRNLKNAVIAIEDRKFFEHWGVNIWSIVRAAVVNLKAGYTVQGGSTITQQLSKIVFLNQKKTLKRKLQEVLLSIELEQRYTKQQILAIYLNRVYLGSGLYGVDVAAKYYFGKNVQDLTLYESAIIAGLIRAPSRYSPVANPELAGHRAYQVLISMVEDEFINKKQLEKATVMPVQLNTEMLGSKKRTHFTEWIYEQVERHVLKEDKDVVVKTTYNRNIDAIASTALKNQINKIEKEREVHEGAVIIMDYEGKILSMVGGRDFSKSSFNRVTQSLRPPGSAFKTIVYATAMERGYSPDNEIEDKEIEFANGWAPQNFNKNFLGYITLEEAFIKSINTVAVQLAESVGLSHIIKTSRKLGITSPLNHDLSLALGSSSVSLLEITSAYGTIGNNGYLLKPYGIIYIRNTQTGEFIYENPSEQSIKVLSDRTVGIMQNLLLATVREGTAKKAQSNFRIWGKTGTSQAFRDACFIGYTDKIVIGLWLGNDDYSPTKFVSGGTYPTILARDILRKIEAQQPSS
jgi:penicillin-binding protein 1A